MTTAMKRRIVPREPRKDGTSAIQVSGHRELSLLEENVLQMLVVGQRLTRAGVSHPPSWREMMGWLGIKSTYSIDRVLAQLERKGFIRRSDRTDGGGHFSRAIEVIR
jgi:SOS-response transcriptional repressor LexA